MDPSERCQSNSIGRRQKRSDDGASLPVGIPRGEMQQCCAAAKVRITVKFYYLACNNRAAAFRLFPPLQVLVYRLPDVILRGRLCVVRELLERGDLPRKQIGWVSLRDLLTRAFLSSMVKISIRSSERRPVRALGAPGRAALSNSLSVGVRSDQCARRLAGTLHRAMLT